MDWAVESEKCLIGFHKKKKKTCIHAQIAITSSGEFYDDLSVMQRQQLARRELQKLIADKTGEINSTLCMYNTNMILNSERSCLTTYLILRFFSFTADIIENALLLLWRHLDFYLNRYNTSASTFGFDADYSRASTATMDYGRRPSVAKGKSYQPPIADVEVLKQDSSIVLQPILNKLVPVELVSER